MTSRTETFAPASLTRDDLFSHYGAPLWVKNRISMFQTDENGDAHSGRSWQGEAVGIRIEASGGKIDLDDNGTARRTEILHAAKRMLLMVVPADSAHGKLRAPDTDALFVAVFADNDDRLVGRGVSSVKDIADIVAGVIFGVGRV